jgi:hypothetical protein
MLKERKLEVLATLTGSSQSLLSQKVKQTKNENVLVSPSSHLVQVLISSHDTARFIITLDSENLLRAWDTISQETVYSYKLPL